VQWGLTRTAAVAAVAATVTAAPACCGDDVPARLRLLMMMLAAAAEFRMQRRWALLALLRRCVRGVELTCHDTGWVLMARMLRSPMAEVRGGADGGAGADAGVSCCWRYGYCQW
jgi:hypothetical protein